MKDVELKLIEEIRKEEKEMQKKEARMEVGAARTIEDLRRIQVARGYAPGWVWQMARVKHITK
jgi:hypothetical protein